MFPCREVIFFEAVLLLAAAGNRICRKSVEKCCFSRISDDTLGSFLARFCNLLVLQRHGVSLPGGDFFEAVLLLADSSGVGGRGGSP